ncbi:AraC family L-rhamnose operon transcriptional activator RhaR [Kribbella amoyensis]|uniref:AraC family L-rhamnose operon transcriptional activator RhaR n=1 Tax=Kribbella amoyensis TaxID=996641 RepID=A0A561B8V5_9ACTN|nr:AraC family transcriptional regulator [Kribbella amoyensis]TWD75219.1 AraC family L-rhamnose operon transcriptional activator RhaR [Kribbella amoyensis]
MPTTLHESRLFHGGPVWGGVHRLSVDVEPHAHDFLEIAVVGPGRGVHRTSQGEQAVRRGQVLVLRPGAWHAFGRCRDLVVANCCVSAQALRSELAGLQQVPILRELLWTTPVAGGPHGVAMTQVEPAAADEAIDEIGRLVQDLDRAARDADEGRGPRAAEGLRGVGTGRAVGRLVTVLGVLADGRVDRDAGPERVVHPAVAATVARFEAAPAEGWRLDEVAEAVSLDPAYLSRLFRRDTGLSPLGYLARLRAERAATLLVESDLPAARVGAAVGWDDPTYFARRFRDLVGLTPSDYRSRTRR